MTETHTTGTAPRADLNVVIREAQPGDAVALINYFRRIFAEPGISMITQADEYYPTPDMERRFISELVTADNSLFLVAEHDGVIVGQLTLQGGKRRSVRHTATLGITVAREWRGRGIGRRLIEEAVAWARSSGILTRIELHVFERNIGAIRLYEQCGFVTEGRRRRAVFRDGQYIDDLVMGLLLEL